MDHRWYFVVGDVLANAFSGALVGLVAVMMVRVGWNMYLAMMLMMVVGMVLSLPLALTFGHWFGAMEVMVPVMQTGMMSGMVVGMWQAMAPLSVIQGLTVGSVTGLVMLGLLWLANSALRGERCFAVGTEDQDR